MKASLADYWSLRYAAGGHFVTRHASQYAGAACAWLAQGAGLSPSQVTLLGTAAFLAGAVLFATLGDGVAPLLGCLLLFQLGYALDCADGQLARATGRTSAFGAWLDVACDHARNVALGAMVAAWLARREAAPLGIAAGVLFACGAAVLLHTAGALRQGATQPAAPRGALRELLTALIDTPTVLLAFALLRPAPVLLGAAAAAIGLAYLVTAVRLARTRL